MTVYDLNTGRGTRSHASRVREINARLFVLHAERTSRMQRRVPLPPGLTEAIEVLERQLVNPHNSHEADMQDEAQGAPNPLPWYVWTAAVGAVVALAALCVGVFL